MKKYLFFLIIIFTSCTARIDINTDDAEPRLIIFGTISDNLQRHIVHITRSTGYFSNDPPPVIDNAIVTITVDNQVFPLNFDFGYNENAPLSCGDYYYFTDSICGEYGKTYTLDVWLDFDNDGVLEHYQAVSKMPKGPRVDSIYLSDYIIDKFPVLFLYGEVFKETENNFCIYTGKNNEPKGLFDYFMIFTPDMIVMLGDRYPLPYFAKGGIHIGDTVNFRVDNLSNDYARFLEQASSEMSVPMPFFSSPPAEVVTNIRCLNANIKVSGFFAAYDRGEDMTTISQINFDSFFDR